MGLRNFFHRQPAIASTTTQAPAEEAQEDLLAPAELADLEAAWADLAAAAEASAITNLKVCTRTGRSWTEDPAAVRAVTATLREFPAMDAQASS